MWGSAMQSSIGVNRLLLVFTLLALPFVVGSSCAFFFSSGGSGGTIVKKDDDDDEEEETGFVQTGTFSSHAASGHAASGPATAGVNFKSGTLTGVTDSNGRFRYIDGEAIQFFIGDISLGAPVGGKPAISPIDLVAQDSTGPAAAANIERLLHSLDADTADDVVTIPAAVRASALRSNASVSSAIEFLDFSDEAAFNNAASQLVAALTDDYPHTATLIDAEDVKASKHALPSNEQAP
jgi:hypothetical protein